MAEITVDVGVRLKAMQSSVADLQKVLDGLQPNSSGFKALQKIITDINRDIDRLRIQTSKPFGSQNQFNQTGKTVDKLEESLEKVKITIDRIKFSDLKLDSSQTAQLDNFKQQLSDIKQEFTAFKADLKTQFLDNDFNKAFVEGINPNLINKNFDEIVKNVENRVNSLGSTLAKAKADLEEFQNASKIGEKIDKASQSANGVVSSDFMGQDMFDKFFQTNSKGIFSFKTGGGLKKGEIQQQFLDYLAGEFQLNQSQIDQLKNQTAGNIRKILMQDDFFNPQKNAAETANKKMSGAESSFTTASKNYENAVAVVARLNPLIAALTNEETSLEDKQKLVNQAIKQFEQDCVNGAKGSKTMDTALNGLDSQLSSFKTQLGQVNTQWLNLQSQQATFNSMKTAIVNFMGFNQVLNLTKKAVKEAMDHIKQLDTVMNGIAIVTDMTTADLWNQIDAYSEMAQRYGTTIQGAYEVSKIYYQAGYETNDVLTLMNETLKLSKVSGLDYATTTDYMMTATRGFHMEVSEAAQVVDVYSALAANTAVSQQELAEAMSKTASSMESVGATFQESSAMIATMVAVTRESANNIGSALKSIGARYGELTKDPTKLFDAEGEAMSFNKVDTALKSVGISLQTADHQFRDFTDVIMELAGMWDTLDSAQQRYIATTFAGNRQQSRFLALVSNKDLLQENMDVAAESEDTGTLQALKALDSLESKLNQVQVAYQQFYTSIGAESVWKGFLDGAKTVIDTLNGLPKVFGKVPLGAIAAVANMISLVKNLLLSGVTTIATQWREIMNKSNGESDSSAQTGGTKIGNTWISALVNAIRGRQPEVQQAMNEAVGKASESVAGQTAPANNSGNKVDTSPLTSIYNGGIYSTQEQWNKDADIFIAALDKMRNSGVEFTTGMNTTALALETNIRKGIISSHDAGQQMAATFNTVGSAAEQNAAKAQNFFNVLKNRNSDWSRGLTGLAQSLTTVGMLLDKSSESGRIFSGVMTGLGGVLQTGVAAVQVFSGNIGALPQLVMGVFNIVNGMGVAWETDAERLERLTKEAENLSNESKKAKAEYNTLQSSIDKLDELKEKRYESAEAAEEYQSVVDELSSKFPEMIAGFDEAGNIILDTTNAERILTEAREKSKQATYDAAKAEMDAAKEKLNEEKKGLTNLQLGLGENNNFNVGKKRYVNFFTDGEGNLIEDSLLEDFGNKQGHGLSNLSLEEGISFETFKNELYDLASKYSEDEVSIWYFLWDYIDQEKETLTDVEALKSELQNKIQSNDEGAQKYQELLNLLTDNTTLEAQSTEIENLLKQIKEPDFDLVANAEQLTSLSLKLEEILKDTNLDENAKAYYETLQAQLKPIIDKVKNIFTLNEAYKGNERIVISAWQEANDNNGKAWEYLEESSGLAAVVTKQIQSDIGDTDYTTAEAEQASKWKEYQAAAEQFYSGLSEADQKIFNQMIEDTANYSGIDITKYFNITEGTDLYNAIINYYSDGVKSIQDRLKNNLTAHHDVDFNNLKETDADFISNYAKLISDENNEFTKNEESFLNSILSQFDSLNKQGFVKRAEVIGLAGINLFKEIQTLPEDIQKSLINSILENGLTTKEGVQKTLDSFKNDKTITNTQVDEYLEQIISQIINNVPLAVQTATSELVEGWDDTSKELTKALSGGLEFKEAEALITKAESLGVSLDLDTDFVQNGDKLILTSEKFNEYWGKLNAQSEENAEKWQADIDAAQAIFLNQVAPNGQKNRISVEDKATMTAIGFDWSQYLDQYGYLTVDGIVALQEAIQNSSEGLERYNTYAQMAAEELKRTQDWIEGNYKETKELKNIDLKELASGNIELGREDFNLRAARDNINSAYNSLISDVLSKGFDKINLEDYSGLIDAGEGIDLANTSYEDFVREYAIWAGKSIEETNALIIQAIEKDTQTTTGAAAEAVGKIQWLSDKKGFASLGDIQNLADALGISVDKILGEYNAQLDSYEVDVSKIDLSKVDNFRDSVYDNINEFLKKVTDGISKGISGKLSGADVTTLTGQLEQLGLKDLTLDFTETIDGLKLSQRSAMELYNELKKIDALQAQLVFDELAKSLEASDTNYTNISTTLARIAELEKAIQGMKPDDARLQMYKNELAVAQEIARTRSSTDNKDFNFMDRALPTGMQNPIDYWNATGEAYKVMNDSAKSGYMEIQDFYNIVQEMSNMAQVSGQTLHFMGQEIDGSAETAAALIQRGFSALTNVKGDGVKIALDNIGVDFKTGAADMKGDFDSGIRQMAKAQIQMLDAAINMLEAIVAMENIGDIDTNGNGIDYGELFDDIWDPNNEEWITKWDKDAQTTIDEIVKAGEKNPELKKAFESFYLEGYSLWELLKDDGEKLTKIGKEGRDKLVEAFNIINELANSDDWEIGNLEQIYKKIEASGLQDLFSQHIYNEEAGFSLIITPDIQTEIDWNSPEIEKRLKETGFKTDEEARKFLDAFAKGEKAEPIDYVTVKILSGDIEITDKNTYKYHGQEFTDKAKLAEIIDKERNFDAELDNIDAKSNTITFSKTIGLQKVTIVQEEDGTTTYKFEDGTTIKASDEETALKLYAENYRQTHSSVANLSDEEILMQRHLLVEEQVEIKINEKVDKQIRDNAETFRNHTIQEINEAIEKGTTTANGEGIIINLGDKTFTLSGTKEELSGKGQEIADLAAQELGIDTALSATISDGISQAFSGESGAKISKAITDGITNAFTNEEKIGEDNAIPVPTITLKPESVTIQLGEKEPTVQGLDGAGIKITSADISADNAYVSSTNYQAGTAESPLTTVSLEAIDSATGEATTLYVNCPDGTVVGEAVTLTGFTASGTATTFTVDNTTGELSTKEAINVPILKADGSITGFFWIDPSGAAYTGLKPGTKIENLKGISKATGEAVSITVECGEKTSVNIDDANVTIDDTVKATAKNGEVTLTKYTVTTTDEEGNVSTIEVYGEAALTATLVGYGAGFDSTTAAETSGTINLVANEVNIGINTEGATTSWDTWLALQEAKKLKLKTEIDEDNSPFSQSGKEGRNQLTTHRTSRNGNWQSGDLDLLLGGSARSNTKSYITDLENLTDAGKEISKVDFSNLEYLKHIIENDSSGSDNSGIYDQIVKILSMSETIESDNLTEISNLAQSFSGLEIGDLPEIATALEDIATQAQVLEGIGWDKIADGMTKVMNAQTGGKKTEGNGDSGTSGSNNNNQGGGGIIDTATLTGAVAEVQGSINSLAEVYGSARDAINEIASSVTEVKTNNIVTATNAISDTKSQAAVKASSAINNINAAGAVAAKQNINSIEGKNIKITAQVGVTVTQEGTKAAGNVTLKKQIPSEDSKIKIASKGNVALAGGKNTLMGELGPELVVSKGRYFVVGQNGPEMVNLTDDAIVFNHLQTQQLLKHGKASGHANPVTNERKATSLATGNANGPAMASASAALDVLKQIRAMWQSLADASLKDLGSMPGGSGGGGGGGGGDKTPAAIKSITQQVERWYNWMKEIEEIQTNLNKLSKEYTLLEKQHISSQTKLANLQIQQAETLRDINTRSGLIKEQKDYRSQEIARVTKEGSAFNAFYGVDEKTGRIYLKNDDTANAGFKEFLKGTNSSLGNVMVNEGKISAGTKIKYKGTYDQEDADKEANVKYQKWLKSKKGKKANQKKRDKQLSKFKDKASKNIGKKKINKTLTTKYDIRTGADLMNELQRKDKQGNNVHDAQEQYLLLDKLGIIKKMPELMAGIDKSQEGWQETAVENFYDAIDADKEAIETLTDSIKEQEEALLDDKIQMQEINEQIREIAKPLPGVTEGFEKWYNELKRIEAIQEKINILSKQNSLLQNDHIANGKEIFLNLKQQDEELQKQLKANEDLYNKQVKGREDLVKKYQSLPIDYDASTGTATFNEKKYNKSIKISHTDTKKNSLGYEVDEQGRYIDNKGILRDANGKELNTSTEITENGLKTSVDMVSKELKTSAEMFGQVQTTTVESTYNTNGKTLPQILEEITSQNANGETAYTAEEQYDILKGLGFEKLLQYDESGKQIYENFGELSKEQMKEAVEAGISRIQGAADEINESTSGINKLTEENLDIQNQLYENESARIQNAINLENLVKDAIVQERQDAIDAKKDLRDALDKAANKTVDGLKESLDREKALYDSDSDSKELTALQAQLILLRSAGGSLGKIRDLESQIQDKQKDMYFAERENSIENLENAAQKQIDALDTQIDIMQTSLDWQVKQGFIWDEVNRKISTEGPDSLASYIIENQEGFLAKSPTEQKESLTEILQTAQFGKAQIEDAKNPQKPKKEEKPEPKKNQPKKESKPEPKKEESKNQSKTASQPATQPKTQTTLTTQQQNDLKSDLQPHLVSDSPKDRPKTTATEEPEKVTVTTVKKGLKYYNKKTVNSKTKPLGKISKGTSFDVKGIGKTKTYTTSKKKKRYMLKAEIGGREVYVPLLYTWLKNGKDLESKLVKSKLPKFAKGGSVDFTGPAWVDGTKNKPEQIFNYDQMEQLRKMFLDNLTATQIGIAGLSSIADKLPNTNSYNNINNENSGVNIDQLDFHMEVEQISNDYDARRAGQAVMEEMVRIARKTGNRSISRR